MKHILFIAWEYPEKSSTTGQALSRRIGQLLNGFLHEGHKITFIHPDHANELTDTKSFKHIAENTNLSRIIVKFKRQTPNHPLLRKISTLLDVLMVGDYSGRWAQSAYKLINEKSITIEQPDVILAFFTPRGPLQLGQLLKKKYKSKLIFDIQDPFHEGIGKTGLINWANSIWSSNAFKQADHIVAINKTWANEMKHLCNTPIEIIDHAIPEYNFTKSNESHEDYVYYSGSLDPTSQDIKPFLIAFDRFSKKNPSFTLMLSVNEKVATHFNTTINQLQLSHIKTVTTGWLPLNELHKNIANCKILLVIPWHDMNRQGIPSKFYEFMYFDKPILVAGKDSGGFSELFKTYECEYFVHETIERIFEALENPERLFLSSKCKNKPISEKQLVVKYTKLLQ